MLDRLGKWWLWLLVNLAGMGLFLKVAALTWIEPELANEPGASGGEFVVWGLSALPILLLFFVVHIVFGFIADRQRIRENRWHGTICVVSTFVCWVGAFLFDNVHHGI